MTDVPRISTICRISPFNQIFFPFLSIFPFSPFFLRVRFINLFLCSYFPYFLSGPYTSEESGSLSSIIDILSNSYSGYSGAGFWSTERAGWLLQWVQLLRITLYAHIGYLLPYCIERLFCLLLFRKSLILYIHNSHCWCNTRCIFIILMTMISRTILLTYIEDCTLGIERYSPTMFFNISHHSQVSTLFMHISTCWKRQIHVIMMNKL